MARICLSAEKHPRTWMASDHGAREFARVDEAVAVATMFTANHMNIKAIVALTESGATPLWMSRIRSDIPIYALSRHAKTRGKVCLYRDVYPIVFDVTKIPEDEVNMEAILTLQKRALIKADDLIILTRGDLMGVHGQSNVMKILQVPQQRR